MMAGFWEGIGQYWTGAGVTGARVMGAGVKGAGVLGAAPLVQQYATPVGPVYSRL